MLQKGPALALGGAHPLTTGPLPGEDDAGDHHHNQQQQPRQQRQQPQGPQRRQGSMSWTEPPSEDPPSRAPTTEGGTNTASGGAGAAEGASSSSSPCPSLASPREVARRRCFDVTEIIHLLTPGITPLPLSSRPPGGGMIGRGAGPGPGPGRDGDDSPPPPPSGTLLLYDRVATRDYKRDGHSWVTKRVSSRKRGNKVAESSVKLRLDGRFRVAGWYARSDGSGVASPTMRRRAYYLIDPDTMRPLGDWVLVHYLDDDVAARAAASASSASTSASMSMSRRARRGGVPGDGEIPQRRRSDEEQVGDGDARRSSAMSPPELLSDDDDAVHHAAGPPSAKVKKVSHDGDGGGGAASNKAPAPSHGDDAEPFSISGALSSFCDLNIAPRLTDEDVAKEWRSSFTEVERRRAMTDVYGSAVAGDHDDDGDCIENGQRQREQQQHQPADPTTPRSVTPCGSGRPMLLESMDYELEMIPRHIKSDYLEARIRCPNLCSSDEVKSSFLRCEANCPKAAAHRMVQYWKKRVEIFGTDRAFLPLTLSGAMAGDSRELSAYARLLPGTDASGRAIIFFDNTATCSFMTRLRSSFYMAHAALENDGALRNGVVIVVFGPPPLAHVDRGLMLERQALFRDVLPVKVRAAHKCLFRRRDDGDRNIPRAYEVLNFTAGREWRARLVAHDGSREQLVLQLGEYGISISQLPSKIGGLVGDDYFAHWFELRRKMGL